MKIARFSVAGSDPRFGILDGDDFVVLAGDPMFSGFDTTGERVPVEQARLLAPVIPRSKVYGVGFDGVVYLKPNTSVIGPDDAIPVPASTSVTAQGVLAIIIGSIARHVAEADAASVIFGYSVATDVTAVELLEAGQWALAKGMDGFAPLGPIMETELDPEGLSVSIGGASGTVGGIGAIVQLVSAGSTLLPGDVILVGTAAPATPIAAGDTVSSTIEAIGTLTNPVRARA